MAKLIVNLTLPFINEKIENVLNEHCDYFYQEAFSLPDLRQELITYVLSRINSLYIDIEAEQQPSSKHNFLYVSENNLHIETIIYQGIYDILPQNNKRIKQHIYEQTELGSVHLMSWADL